MTIHLERLKKVDLRELDDVEVQPRKKYIGFVRDRSICSMLFRRKK